MHHGYLGCQGLASFSTASSDARWTALPLEIYIISRKTEEKTKKKRKTLTEKSTKTKKGERKQYTKKEKK